MLSASGQNPPGLVAPSPVGKDLAVRIDEAGLVLPGVDRAVATMNDDTTGPTASSASPGTEPTGRRPDAKPSPRQLVAKLRAIYKSESVGGLLARGASWSFGLQTGALLLSAAVQVTLARALGDDGYGRYTYVLGWMQVAAVLTVFEFDATAVRFVSMYSSSDRWGLLRGFQRTAFWFTSGVSIVVGGTAAVGIWAMWARIDPTLAVPGLITCAMLPVVTLTIVQSGALQGQRLIAQSELAGSLRPLVFLLLLFVVVIVRQHPLSTEGALGLGWVAAAVTLLLTAYLVRRASSRAREVSARYRMKEWFGMSAGLLPGAFAQLTLGATTDVVIVGSILGPASAGVYSKGCARR